MTNTLKLNDTYIRSALNEAFMSILKEKMLKMNIYKHNQIYLDNPVAIYLNDCIWKSGTECDLKYSIRIFNGINSNNKTKGSSNEMLYKDIYNQIKTHSV